MTPHRPQDLPLRRFRNFSFWKTFIPVLALAIIGFVIIDHQQDKYRTERYNAAVDDYNEAVDILAENTINYNRLVAEQNRLVSPNLPRYIEIEDELRRLERDAELLAAKLPKLQFAINLYD